MNHEVKIMGILNVTPDSFSDGGRFLALNEAIEHAFAMISHGADIIDIGGESSGPGSPDVSLYEESKRVLPLVEAILERDPNIFISLDTYKSALAKRAVLLGVKMINDVTALRGDRDMAGFIAESGVKIVVMYAKDDKPRTTVMEKEYDDVIATIREFFLERLAYLKSQGVLDDQIILDPGLGHFVSSLPKYSFEIIDRLSELKDLGYPILLGPSRKSFLGGALSGRDEASIEIALKAAQNGADILRMHNVSGLKTALANL